MPASTTTNGGGRWCPTPEQVMLLEGMYRGGLKTPTATQIQHIVSRLSVYGKIQGKNVFYWFQNHKARDRQKIRKKLMALYQQHRLYDSPALDHPLLPLHPVDGIEDVSNSKPMMNKWMVDCLPFDHQPCKLMCDCPLMTMMLMDHHGTTPRIPPKTLQLFPLTTTDDLKQDDVHQPPPLIPN